eukprot:795748-Ditylum_brightwellii.AAC.1
MALIHHWLIGDKSKELEDAYKYDKDISCFSKSSGGVCHAVGQIGDTKVWNYLLYHYGLFNPQEKISVQDQSDFILQAISFCIGKTAMYAENLVCKAMQELHSTANARWVDSFFYQQGGLFDIVASERKCWVKKIT